MSTIIDWQFFLYLYGVAICHCEVDFMGCPVSQLSSFTHHLCSFHINVLTDIWPNQQTFLTLSFAEATSDFLPSSVSGRSALCTPGGVKLQFVVRAFACCTDHSCVPTNTDVHIGQSYCSFFICGTNLVMI